MADLLSSVQNVSSIRVENFRQPRICMSIMAQKWDSIAPLLWRKVQSKQVHGATWNWNEVERSDAQVTQQCQIAQSEVSTTAFFVAI